MFLQSTCNTSGSTLQRLLIANCRGKRCHSDFTAAETATMDPPPMNSDGSQQDDHSSGHQTYLNARIQQSDPVTDWITCSSEGYQTNGDFCGHTTCGERCMFSRHEPATLGKVDSTDLNQYRQSVNGFYSRESEQQTLPWESGLPPGDARPRSYQGEGVGEIDIETRQLIDAELDLFRAKLHSILTEQHHWNSSMLAKDHGNQDVNFPWSPMSQSEQTQVEESSSSNYSMPEEDAPRRNLCGDNDDDINSLLIELLTSSSIISQALKRQEYAT